MKLQKLSNDRLKSRLEKLVRHERKVMALVIEHIAEVERRRLYHHWSFKSLFDYLVFGLGYSESAAYRRMQAARALIQIPEIKLEIENGSLNLSQISLAQTAIRNEQKQNGPLPLSAKIEIFSSLRDKTAVESQKILDQTFGSASVSPVVEKFKADDSLELTVRLPKEVVQKLDRIKELYSHMVPDGNWVLVIDQMADDVLAKRDPLKKKAVDVQKTMKPIPMRKETGSARTIANGTSELRSENRTQGNTDAEGKMGLGSKTGVTQKSPQALFVRRKPLRESVRRFIFQRDQSCQYRHPDGSTCNSRHQLEIDHIHPHFAGGSDRPENLRVLCRLHNQHRYRPKMRL